MPENLHAVLTRRERQIMDVLFRRGRATAAEVMEDLPGSPSYLTVRTQLRVLEEKGHVRHEEEGVRYVYTAAVRRHAARGRLLDEVGSGPRRRRRRSGGHGRGVLGNNRGHEVWIHFRHRLGWLVRHGSHLHRGVRDTNIVLPIVGAGTRSCVDSSRSGRRLTPPSPATGRRD